MARGSRDSPVKGGPRACRLRLLDSAQPCPARIIITATRVPEPDLTTREADTLISGEEVRARGALELRSALAPAAGVEVLPGNDTGPAGSVVAMQALQNRTAICWAWPEDGHCRCAFDGNFRDVSWWSSVGAATKFYMKRQSPVRHSALC